MSPVNTTPKPFPGVNPLRIALQVRYLQIGEKGKYRVWKYSGKASREVILKVNRLYNDPSLSGEINIRIMDKSGTIAIGNRTLSQGQFGPGGEVFVTGSNPLWKFYCPGTADSYRGIFRWFTNAKLTRFKDGEKSWLGYSKLPSQWTDASREGYRAWVEKNITI